MKGPARALFVHFLLAALVLPILPALGESYHISPVATLLLEAAFPVGAAVGFLWFGRWGETRGIGTAIRFSWLAQMGAMAALGLWHTSPGFAVLRFFGGISTGLLPAAIASSRLSGNDASLKNISTLIAAVTAGSALGPLISTVIIQNLYAIAILGMIISALGYLANRNNAGAPSCPIPQKGREVTWAPLLLFVGIMASLGILFQTSRLLLPFYEETYLSFSPPVIGASLAVLSWGAWVAQKVLGRFASFSPLQLPLVYTGTVFTTLAGIALLFSGDHFFFWSGILVVAASIGLADPIGSALCLRYTKPHVAGRTMGIIFTILALAKTLAPPLAAWLIHLMP